MKYSLPLAFALTLAVVIFSSASSSSASPVLGGEMGASNEGGDVNDAIKYLEELDKYYSQVARPRQRRVGQNMASALEKLSQIKNYYNEAGRPSIAIVTIPVSAPSSPDAALTSLVESLSHLGVQQQPQPQQSPRPLVGLLGERPIQVARRETEKMKALQTIDTKLAHMSRPRFGKRSGNLGYPLDAILSHLQYAQRK